MQCRFSIRHGEKHQRSFLRVKDMCLNPSGPSRRSGIMRSVRDPSVRSSPTLDTHTQGSGLRRSSARDTHHLETSPSKTSRLAAQKICPLTVGFGRMAGGERSGDSHAETESWIWPERFRSKTHPCYCHWQLNTNLISITQSHLDHYVYVFAKPSHHFCRNKSL